MSNQIAQIRDLRKALCVGGIFAVSTVLPEKIQHLAFHVSTISRAGNVEVVEHSLQVLGCFLVLSVLIWASRTEPRQVHPLQAYPPHSGVGVLAHTAGLAVGVKWFQISIQGPHSIPYFSQDRASISCGRPLEVQYS